jgi:FHS family L-fucose permease-like MFS transporter
MVKPFSFSARGGLAERVELWVLLSIFLLWGLSNSINHLLIHQFMHLFRLNRLEASVAQPAYYLGYVGAALPAAALARRRGVKFALCTGLALFAAASAFLAGAAIALQFRAILGALFLLAVSASVMESTVAPLVLRSRRSEAGVTRLLLGQAINSLGMVGGAALGTYVIFPRTDASAASPMVLTVASHRTAAPFLAFVVVGCVFLAIVRKLPLRGTVSEAEQRRSSLLRPLRVPAFRLALGTAFVYMGVQICSWSFLLQYVRAYAVNSDRAAGLFYMATLALFALGRFAQTGWLRSVRPLVQLRWASVAGAGVLLVSVLYPGRWGAVALVATSLFLSVMYPALFAMAVQPMGEDSQTAGALMVLSISAGAIVPPLMAAVAEATHSYALGLLVPMAGYAWMAGYGWLAGRVRRG